MLISDSSITIITTNIWNGRVVAERKIWNDLFDAGKRVIFWLEYNEDNQDIARGACIVEESDCCDNCRHVWEWFDPDNDNEVMNSCNKLWIEELEFTLKNICPEFKN